MNRDMANEIAAVCTEEFVVSGFVKYRKDRVCWPLTADFEGWVGLNEGLHSTFLRINPNIGIHAPKIARFYTSLEARKYNRGVATFAMPLGTLCPKEDQIIFTPDGPHRLEARRLVDLYVKYAVPWYESHANYEEILPLLRGKLDMLGGYPERLATCLYFMGKKEEAREFTTNFLKRKPSYFEAFAVPFLGALDEKEPNTK